MTSHKDPVTLQQQVRYFSSLKYKLTQENSELRRRLKEIDEELKVVESVLNTLESRACPACHGFGTFRVQYAQDDIRTETRDTCKGLGEVKKP